MSATMLKVKGMVQREGEVIHVIAERLENCTPLLNRIGKMPFPHRRAPADGANGGSPDRRDHAMIQIKNDYFAPFRNNQLGPGLHLKSRNFH
jgi:error-prone DNA polymerase